MRSIENNDKNNKKKLLYVILLNSLVLKKLKIRPKNIIKLFSIKLVPIVR